MSYGALCQFLAAVAMFSRAKDALAEVASLSLHIQIGPTADPV